MKKEIASAFYNNAGVTDENIPFSERSTKLVNQIRSYRENLIFQNAKTLISAVEMNDTHLNLKK